MNLKIRDKRPVAKEIEGLHIATGGFIVTNPLAESIPESNQPSDTKTFIVFGIAMSTLLVGTAMGWVMANHFSQVAKEKAELAASAAKFDLQRNQAQIDNFCLENSSLVKK